MDKTDSDSGHSPLDDEKNISARPVEFQALSDADLPPDPDADLSAEEKARIVGIPPSLLLDRMY